MFLLNQCPPAQQTARVQDGVETLEEMGGLISPLILTRVDYQESARHGWGVTELNPYGAAAEEMRGLWQSVRRRLARVKVRRPPARRLEVRSGPGPARGTEKRGWQFSLHSRASAGRFPSALPFFLRRDSAGPSRQEHHGAA